MKPAPLVTFKSPLCTLTLSGARNQLLSVSSIISSLLKRKRAVFLERTYEDRVISRQKSNYQEKPRDFRAPVLTQPSTGEARETRHLPGKGGLRNMKSVNTSGQRTKFYLGQSALQ